MVSFIYLMYVVMMQIINEKDQLSIIGGCYSYVILIWKIIKEQELEDKDLS